MPTLTADVLESFAEALFRASNVPPDEAERVAKSLVDANLCGHDSHGVIRIPQYVEAIRDGRLRPGAPFTVVKETAAVLVVDGGSGLGQVQAHRLLERLDMFAGGLSGAPCSTPGAPSLSMNAVVFLVLDIAQFAGAAHFLKEVTQLAENVRACPRAAGVPEILLPGDPERREKAKRLQTGIPLDEGTWGQLCQLAQELKVALPP